MKRFRELSLGQWALGLGVTSLLMLGVLYFSGPQSASLSLIAGIAAFATGLGAVFTGTFGVRRGRRHRALAVVGLCLALGSLTILLIPLVVRPQPL